MKIEKNTIYACIIQFMAHKNKKKSRNHNFTQIFAALDDLKNAFGRPTKKKNMLQAIQEWQLPEYFS